MDSAVEMTEEYLTPEEIARRLGCGTPDILQWISAHVLPAYTVGGQYHVSLSNYVAFLERSFLMAAHREPERTPLTEQEQHRLFRARCH